MVIHARAVGPFFKNGFLLGCERTAQAVAIDPGDEVDQLVSLAAAGLDVRAVLLTHAHVDHVTGLAAARRAWPAAPIFLHRADQFLYDRAVQMGAMFGLQVDPLPPVDRYYEPGEVIAFGDCEVRWHHTPGHGPGGVCLQAGRAGEPGGGLDLFVGDTLFAGSIGRTDLPGGDFDTLIHAIRTTLFAFGDEARVHPGHGPSTTIGDERRTNPFLVPA